MTTRLTFLFVLALALIPAFRATAADEAGRRVALVIGNAKYPDADTPLKEPVGDARAMADELKRAGFDVAVGENLTRDAMQRAVDNLYGKIKAGSVALIFFSGYGIQSGRQSFMIPVDGQIWTEADVRRDGFSLDAILNEINSRGATVKLAILDASRRNPFERRFRSFSAGLAPVTAPRGTLVMYSAAPSTVVSDATSDHSLFVTELLKEIRVPGLTAEEALNRTRVGVSRASQGDQVPWFSTSLAEEFSFGQEPRIDTLAANPPDTKIEQVAPNPAAKSTPAPVVTAPKPQLEAPAPNLSAIEPKAQPTEPIPQAVPPPPEPAKPVVTEAEKRKADALANDPAIRELTDLLQTNPNDQAAYYKRGQLYASKGGYPEAIKDFDEAIRLNPNDVEALNNRCFVRSILNELQSALKDCNDALRLRPNFVDALDSRGLANLKSGQINPAIADFDAALKLNPKLASSLFGRGIAKSRNGAATAGNRDIAAAKQLSPDIADEFAGYGVR